MDTKKINIKKKPIVTIDETLDFFNDKVLFPEKLAKANKMLKEIGLPKPKAASRDQATDSASSWVLAHVVSGVKTMTYSAAILGCQTCSHA